MTPLDPENVDGYFVRLGKNDPNGAQFYARADSLADYLDLVSTRMGSLSQRLSASVGQLQLEGDAPVDPSLPKAAGAPQIVKTPWNKIDDIFYESRGYTCTPSGIFVAPSTEMCTDPTLVAAVRGVRTSS